MKSLFAAALVTISTYLFLGGTFSRIHFKRLRTPKFQVKRQSQMDQDFLEFLWNLKSELSSGAVNSKIETEIPNHQLSNRLNLILELSKQSGTPVTPVINRFIKQTKNQIELKQEIASELASTKATVIILASLPILGIFLSSLLSGNSLNWLFGTGAGRLCLGIGAGLNLIGLYWIKRIIRSALVA